MPVKVEFFNDSDIVKIEKAMNDFLAKPEVVFLNSNMSQSSYVDTDPDTDMAVAITVITVCIYYEILNPKS